ncbi:MAG: DMT family transporter [Desulfobulbaceae bacterium]|nr:DMT family transporter [Desulfobulbaceae bacterium]
MRIQKPHDPSRLVSDLILLLAALIWGGGFVAQRSASFHLGFFAFNGLRFLLGGLVMLPFVIKRLRNSPGNLKWIIPAGLLLFSASALQQAGVTTTSAGTAGFITGVYVVLVPLFMALIWKHKTNPVVWVAAAAALFGTYLLSTSGAKLTPSSGNIILLMGSVLWAFHVIVVGFAVKKVDVFVFSVGQFLLCGILHLLFSVFVEPPTLAVIQSSWLSILYAGLASVAIGFTLQAVGQRKAPASDAALILSLESVFAAVFGALLLSERMNFIQIIGCAIILIAIVCAQLPSVPSKEQKNTG